MPRCDSEQSDRRCVSCGYALHGLPPVHDCPECGFCFDPHAVVIKLHGNRLRNKDFGKAWALPFGIALLIGIALGGRGFVFWLYDDAFLSRWGLPDNEPTRWGRFLFLGLLCAVSVVAGMAPAIRFWKRWGRRQELRINALGIQFIDPAMPDHVIPWDRIDEVNHDDYRKELVVKDRTSGHSIVVCPTAVFGDSKHAEYCAQQILAKREIYRGLKAKD